MMVTSVQMTDNWSVMRHVFDFLPLRDIDRCRFVCKNWARWSLECLKQRRKLELIDWEEERHQQLSEDVEEFLEFDDLADFGNVNPNRDMLLDLNAASLAENVKTKISEKFSAIRCIPAAMLLFVSNNVTRRHFGGLWNIDAFRSSFSDNFSQLMCEPDIIQCCGTISCDESGEIFETESPGTAISGLVVPRHSTVSVQRYIITSRDFTRAMQTGSEVFIPRSSFPRIMIAFTRSSNLASMRLNLTGLVNQQQDVWVGAGVHALHPQSSDKRLPLASVYILSLSAPNLRAASIVVGFNQDSHTSIRTRLLQLKSTGVQQQNARTLGLMFSAEGRGRHIHIHRNFESNLFREVFPEVPLVGCFCSAQIGFDWLPDYQNANIHVERTEFIDPLHEFSTVFAVISF